MTPINERIKAVWWLSAKGERADWFYRFGQYCYEAYLSPSRVVQFQQHWPRIFCSFALGQYGAVSVSFEAKEMIETPELRDQYMLLEGMEV